jgi:hypothetical protein
MGLWLPPLKIEVLHLQQAVNQRPGHLTTTGQHEQMAKVGTAWINERDYKTAGITNKLA